jgi:DNA-binding MarR family transcriptional regulator
MAPTSSGKAQVKRASAVKSKAKQSAPEQKQWTFLSNHGHVLIFLAHDPAARVRDIAAAVGITERSAQIILADLEATGYLTKKRIGRRNEYTIKLEKKFRHPSESHKSIRLLLDIFN